MVGKTRLYQHTGSPLIQGMNRRRRGPGRVIITVVLLTAVIAVVVYLVYLR